MASSWGSAWAASWGGAWASGAAEPEPDPAPPPAAQPYLGFNGTTPTRQARGGKYGKDYAAAAAFIQQQNMLAIHAVAVLLAAGAIE